MIGCVLEKDSIWLNAGPAEVYLRISNVIAVTNEKISLNASTASNIRFSSLHIFCKTIYKNTSSFFCSKCKNKL